MSVEMEQAIEKLMHLIDSLEYAEQKRYVAKVQFLFEERKTLLAVMDGSP